MIERLGYIKQQQNEQNSEKYQHEHEDEWKL